jgi:hypothetical protein
VLLGAALAAIILAAAPAVADPTVPELDVYTYDQDLGRTTDVSLEVVLVPSSPAVENIAITLPAGYRMTAKPVGTQLGPAEIDVVPAAGGPTTRLKGNVVVADPATLASDPQVQACAPGTHGGAWRFVLTGSQSIAIPVAVDQLSTGGSYKLVACLDALRAANLKPVDVWLKTQGVVGNPSTKGTYVWSALVTMFNAAGAPDPTTAFEARGDEPLPETLTLKSSFDASRKMLTLRGALTAAGKSRTSVRVHLYAGATPNSRKMKEIGVAVTTKSGAYVLQRRLAHPAYVWGHVGFYYSARCDQPSSAPGGCAAETIDGTDSSYVKVPR